MRTGPLRPVRIFSFRGGLAAIALATASVVLPVPAIAQTPIIAAGKQGISDFYAERQGRPLWFSQGGRQVDDLLEILNSAHLDGLRPEIYRTDLLTRAVWAAQSGKPKAVRRADMMLSQALVAYVRDLRQPGDTGVIYVDPELKPGPPSPRAILEAAERALLAGALRCRNALDASHLRPTPPGVDARRQPVAGTARPGAHQP